MMTPRGLRNEINWTNTVTTDSRAAVTNPANSQGYPCKFFWLLADLWCEEDEASGVWDWERERGADRLWRGLALAVVAGLAGTDWVWCLATAGWDLKTACLDSTGLECDGQGRRASAQDCDCTPLVKNDYLCLSFRQDRQQLCCHTLGTSRFLVKGRLLVKN